MTALITILISLLGYGSPSDYDGYTQTQLENEIAIAEASSNADGGAGSFDDVN